MSRDMYFADPYEEYDEDDECVEGDGTPALDYAPEDIDDAQVRWSIGDNGVGRIEVTP